eukprot:6214827-Pleurochrysis_carterae.AAC.6
MKRAQGRAAMTLALASSLARPTQLRRSFASASTARRSGSSCARWCGGVSRRLRRPSGSRQACSCRPSARRSSTSSARSARREMLSAHASPRSRLPCATPT